MDVAIYAGHHGLPFWGDSSYSSWGHPWIKFDPGKMREWGHKADRVTGALVNAQIWPVLLGLHQMNLPFLAHVSAGCRVEGRDTIEQAHRRWIQISSSATETDEEGLPVLVHGEADSKHVLVTHLWGGDNRTYSPIGLLSDDERDQLSLLRRGRAQAGFWAEFFTNKLRTARSEALSRIAEHNANVGRLLGVANLLDSVR
jgi:hypothetical protein